MDLTALFDIINSAWPLLILLPIVGYVCWRNPYEYNTFADCVAAIGGNAGTIMIPNEQIIDDNLIIPANITLEFIHGGYLDIAAGKIVTINGLRAGLYRVFSGDGTVTLGTNSVREIYPQWWGASPSATDSVNAAALISALSQGIRMHIPEGTYGYDTLIDIPVGVVVTGDGAGKTILHYSGGDAYAVSLGDDAVIDKLKILQDTDRVTVRAGLYLGNTTYGRARDLKINGFRYGVKLHGHTTAGCAYNDLYSIIFWDNFYDLYFMADTNGWCNENRIFGGKLTASPDAGSYGAYIEHYATNPLNENKFFGVGIETLKKGVFCDGVRNSFLSCRHENVNEDIEWGANSNENLILTPDRAIDILDNSGGKNQIITTDSIEKIGVNTPVALTIAGGVITVTKSYHILTPQGGAVDDLDTINGGTDGMLLTLKGDGTFQIDVKHGTGNIFLSGGVDYLLPTTQERITLMYDGTRAEWIEYPKL